MCCIYILYHIYCIYTVFSLYLWLFTWNCLGLVLIWVFWCIDNVIFIVIYKLAMYLKYYLVCVFFYFIFTRAQSTAIWDKIVLSVIVFMSTISPSV